MSLMRVTLDGQQAFRPGDLVRATAEWDLPGLPAGVVASLVWIARGGGPDEEGLGVSVSFERPQSRERRTFELQAPSGPYSYQGKLFSIGWAVEVRAEPNGPSSRAELVIGPGARALAARG